ncbi:MAG: hypothetical protein FWB80_01755 [Defluviitaleaceae bacterium]|nr:hypothetical protein [Defluviitaleaceae bacterium]
MAIFELIPTSVPVVATMMAEIMPEWWEYKSAFKQLSDISEAIESIGWYIGEDKNHPIGWAFFREYKSYRTIELECCGYNDNGIFALEHKMKELFDRACEYAKSKGYLTFRTVMGSTQFSIHDRPLGDIGDEIKNLESYKHIDYDWLLSYGFRVIGIQPNAYEINHHAVILAKDLT